MKGIPATSSGELPTETTPIIRRDEEDEQSSPPCFIRSMLCLSSYCLDNKQAINVASYLSVLGSYAGQVGYNLLSNGLSWSALNPCTVPSFTCPGMAVATASTTAGCATAGAIGFFGYKGYEAIQHARKNHHPSGPTSGPTTVTMSRP